MLWFSPESPLVLLLPAKVQSSHSALRPGVKGKGVSAPEGKDRRREGRRQGEGKREEKRKGKEERRRGGREVRRKGGREKKLNLPSSAFLFHLALKQVRWCLLL